MGQLRKFGPKKTDTKVFSALQDHKLNVQSLEKKPDLDSHFHSLNQSQQRATKQVSGLNQETHEALLQLITELEELLEDT